MNLEKIKQAGKNLSGTSWTDEELNDIIASLHMITSFLEGLGQNKIVYGYFRRELEYFQRVYVARHG